MSNIIPPLLSNSPPPPPTAGEDEEDEFGDFTVANDLSYGCDGFSPSPSPDISSGERSPFSIPNVLDHVERDKEAEKNIEDKERKIFDCDCSKENSVCSDISCKNNEIISETICASDEGIPIGSVLTFSDCDRKHSCNDLGAKENICLKINNNEDLFHSTHMGDIEISYRSDNANINICRDQIHIKDSTFTLNSLDQTSTSDDNSGISKNKRDSDENLMKPLFFQQNELSQENLVADVSADLEVDEILSKSLSSAANCDRADSHQNIVAYVSDESDVQKNSLTNSFDPSRFDFFSNLQGKSNCEVFIEKDLEESLKNIAFNETEVEYGEFTDFSGEVEEEAAQKSDLFKDNCNIPESSKENRNSLESAVEKDPEVAANFTWFSPSLDNIPQVAAVAEGQSNDEFADFASHQMNEELSGKFSSPDNDEQDDFEDFGDFTSTVCDNPPAAPFPYEADDFQSFADFSKTSESAACLLLNEKEAFGKAEQILKEMFPALEEVLEDFRYFELTENDFIFKQLQDVTDTPALTYQWSKSAGQKALLKSLNIDARNILYGPSWNSSMPRFAANLGLQPLEPIKTEQPTSSVLKPSPSIPQKQNADIPSAQFDWTGSGLVNPLDSVPKDATSPLTDHSGPPEPPVEKKPDTFFQHSNPTPENASGNELDEDDFDDFTSYQSPEVPQMPDWSNALPLRETYISNTTMEAVVGPGIEAWLQPTIVTPELPRKSLVEVVDEEISPEVVTPDEAAKKDDDVFTSFQVSSTEQVDVDRPLVGDSSSSQKLAYDFLSDFDSIRTEGVVSGVVSGVGSRVEPSSFGQVRIDCAVETKGVIENGPVQAPECPPEEEDEFTDFQFSKPQTTNAVLFSTPIMEPLKPVPVYSKNNPQQINWPDPGITDDEIRKFEEVFSHPTPPKQEEPAKPCAASPLKQRSSADEEEWTEFVSVQKPSPVHKLRANDRERTSSPDLPLSVFNLGSIQPTKQPIPVITPHGLVQTKLSVGSASSSPKTQARHVSNCRPPFVPVQQPLTISEQYVSQAYGFSAASNHNSAGLKSCNASSASWSFASQAAEDEDEWGEFVSSPLPPPPQQNGWSGPGASVIANARRLGSGGGSRVSGKGAVSNLVLPELDFIAPKGRTATSRKK